ncbi:hypothetical protein L596_009055 [Steinernema carpocapsae]|uniref:Serine/threonine-protein phosphatase n=1 Tax=Steinernema carpocapsae TaxID=34508 RepID=A0A4U5PEI9_STECR|nr:hypothetical protein L596_009055 [Steinernema carpocapsae]
MDKSKSAAPTLKTEEVKPHDVPSKKDVEEAKKSAIDAPKTAEAKKEESLPTPTKKLNLKALIKEHLLVKYEVKPDEMFQMDYEAAELYELLDLAKKAFMKEKTLIEVAVPINICGDTHGQFADVRQIFTACGLPFKSRYLFLGDYVDRGMNSLEVIVLLFACKIRFPRNVYLLRGNHELRNINKVYGFHADLRERYRQNNEFEKLYKKFNEVFSYMPLAAIVSGRILCMHGGLSPYLNSLDDIRNIQRPLGKPVGLAQDLLWADPEKGVTKMFDGAKGFEPNKLRAVSFIFGEVAVEEKCKKLGIEMVIRAHQVVEYGYAFFANRKVITVFSASEYDTNLHNFGGVVQVDKQLEIRFVQINARDYRPNSLRTEVDDNQNEEEHPRTGDVPEDEDAGGNTVRTDIK